MGIDYSYLGVTNKNGKLYIAQATAREADKGNAETENVPFALHEKTFYLRVNVAKEAICKFSFSTDGQEFSECWRSFQSPRRKMDWRESRFVFIPEAVNLMMPERLILIGFGLKNNKHKLPKTIIKGKTITMNYT